MSTPVRIRRALISVYDKTGLVEFARALHGEFGIELISTGGTAKVLKDAGLPVTLVEELTGFPEMLDGRVKTLHPKIHAAILADRDNPEHMRQLAEQGIEPIDMVVVNLYPFEQTIAKPGCTFEEAIEMIDIGGPCLLRAAAKNHEHVLVLCNQRLSNLYGFFLELMRRPDWGDLLPSLRSDYAQEAFWATSYYDARIDEWLGGGRLLKGSEAVRDYVLHLDGISMLRYGENPHQAAQNCLLYPLESSPLDLNSTSDAILGGLGEMSFNNYADANAALELCAELTRAKLSRTARLRLAGWIESDRTAGLCPADSSEVHRFATIHDDRTTRRKLPHWQIPGATYWITFRSIIGVLNDDERQIAFDAMRFWDGKKVDLHALAVMPDHVHALLTPRTLPDRAGEFFNLSEVLGSAKGYCGRLISQGRGGVGQTWDTESYDHWIRDQAEFQQKWSYIAENPVKEGLARTPDQYRWWYAVDLFGLRLGRPVSAETPVPPVLGGQPQVAVGREVCKAEPCSTVRKAEPCDTVQDRFAAVCFIKHTNACGAAIDADPLGAYRRAYLGDPNAALGGILAVNFHVDAAFAEAVMETYQRFGKPLKEAGQPNAPQAFFVEVWLAPSFDEEAVQIVRGSAPSTPERPNPPRKDWGQRVRLLAVGDMSAPPDPDEMDFKRIAGGMLVQTRDLVGLNEDQWKVVTNRQPTEAEMNDLRLAWLICKHTKSNAISICQDGTLIGNGAGQMSRVMSCRIATWLAQENGHTGKLKGAVAASDGFFPFRDGPDLLADAGVTALIQPGGSKRDAEVITACNEHGVAMILTGTRHFKH